MNIHLRLLQRVGRIIALDCLQRDLQSEVARQTLRAENLTHEMMLALSRTIDAKDHYTSGHSERVAAYSAEIERGAGTQFDPEIAKILLAMINEDGNYRMTERTADNQVWKNSGRAWRRTEPELPEMNVPEESAVSFPNRLPDVGGLDAEAGLCHCGTEEIYLNAAEQLGVLPMFFLKLSTGLRKGEQVALQWSDLDTEAKMLTVNKQAIGVQGGGVKVTSSKTETSVRRIAVSEQAIELLTQEHEKHPSNPYLFPSPRTGGMYHPDSIVNLHKKILKRAGLEPLRLHDLRHTFATLTLQNGVDIKTVSGMLGHYDAGFTLRTYTHATDKMQERAAETMGNLMAQSM